MLGTSFTRVLSREQHPGDRSNIFVLLTGLTQDISKTEVETSHISVQMCTHMPVCVYGRYAFDHVLSKAVLLSVAHSI